jgi:AraC family transcriptional regulator, regulatory protein of adaptative response / methylated-DNA-[protein]-cysteine methyltransferase
MTKDAKQAAADYARVERAIRFLAASTERRPSLAEVARSAGLSPAHFQRLFTRWAGISPKRFLLFLTKEHAVELLRRSATVLEAAFDAGLSGPGRLHDLIVSAEAATPGEVASGGKGIVVAWGFAATPFGESLLGVTDRGLCHLAFVGPASRAVALEDLRRRWPRALLREDRSLAERTASRAFTGGRRGRLGVHLSGTNFQLKVWEALLRVPAGTAITYAEVARRIGRPTAARAVAGAVAANPVAWIIPCHRVLRTYGGLGGYRWGLERKQAMLGWEAARAAPASPEGSAPNPAVSPAPRARRRSAS